MPPFDMQVIHWPTLAEFVAYLDDIDRPSWCHGITNHNTFIPNALQWRGLVSMQSMRQTYVGKGWSAGPNLYLAAEAPNPNDRGIWQMTPITHVGVHAGPCNSDHLGVENVGDFDAAPPSVAQYQLLLDVNRAILQRWGIPPENVNVHNECMTGRTCPGKYLTGAQIRADLMTPIARPPVITPDTALLAPPRASQAQCVAYLTRRPTGEYTPYDVASIVRSYYAYAAGLDPVLALAQMIHETGALSSALSQRKDRDGRPLRNPAGIGVTGELSTTPHDGYVWNADIHKYSKALGFTSWELSAKSHIGRLLAYALSVNTGTLAQQTLISNALAQRPLPATYRGIAPALRGLNGHWAVPGTFYADKIAEIMTAICNT